MSLRTGFTTGAYAAATSLAAWRCIHGKKNGKHIKLLFPDGKTRKINIDGWKKIANGAEAWAKKDAGDDIDITNGVLIKTSVTKIRNNETVPEDYKEKCGLGTIFLRAGKGVGISTRAGLEIPVGKWAITPTPRKMIVDNLKQAGMTNKNETLLIKININNGELLAKKTLNPMLGIKGGLSVLGTSGIVVPCSNAAYIKTIEILLKGIRRSGGNTAVFVTGGRSHDAAKKIYPELPEVAFIRIGDFIYEACTTAGKSGFNKLIICCMPGKLAKYALGHKYTHAHHAALSMRQLALLLQQSDLTTDLSLCKNAKSVREFLFAISNKDKAQVISIMTNHAYRNLKRWSPGMNIEIRILDFNAKKWLI